MNTTPSTPRTFQAAARWAAGLALALMAPASALAQTNPLVKVDGSWSSNANGSLGTLGSVWNQREAIQATATATLGTGGNAGKVMTVTVTNPGAGYTSPPVVTVTAGSGTGAVVVANLSHGHITSFTVQNGGSGYSGTATVTISTPAPGGVGSWIRLNTDISANRVLTLDGNRTYGQLVIGDLSSSQTYTINQGTGGSLTFNNGNLSMGSFINKFQGGTDAINTPIILENQLNVRVTTSRLTLGNTITGNGHMLTSYGNGTLALTGNNTGSNFDLWLWNRGTTSTAAQVELGATTGNAVGGNIIIGSASKGTSGHAVLQLLQGRSNLNQISDTATVTFDSYSGSGRNNYFKLMGGNETVGRILDMGSLAVIENREAETVSTGSRLTISGSQNSFITGFARDKSGNNQQQADADGNQSASSLAITQGGGGLLTMQGGNIIFTGGLTIDANSAVRLIQTTNFRSDVVNNGTLYFDTGTLGATSVWNFMKTYADPDGSGSALAPTNRHLIISGSGSIEKTGNAILNLSGRSVTALTDVVNHQIGGSLTVRNGTLRLTGLGSGAGAVVGTAGVPNDGILLEGDVGLNRNLGLYGRITVNGDIVATGRYNNTGSAINVRGGVLDQGNFRQGYYQEGRLTVNGNISLNYIDMNVGGEAIVTATSGSSTNNSNKVSVTNSAGLAVGMRVTGNGVATDTFIQQIDPVTGSITLSKNASISGATALEFSGQSQNPDGVIDGALGSISIAGRPNFAAGTPTPGGLYIINSRASNVGNRIPDSAAINMRGGVVALVNDGAASTNFSEQLGTLNLLGGQSQITNYLAASGATSTLRFAGLNRSYGTTVEFVGVTGTGSVANINDATNLLGTTTRNQIRFDSGVSNGFMGGWAWANNEFVKYNTSTGVSVMTASDYLTTTDTGNQALNSWLAGSNVKLTLGTTLTMTTRRAINSLNFQSVGRTLAIGGNVLSIESGGLLSNAGNNTISSTGNGYLTVGTAAGALGELNVIVGTTLNTSANTTSVNTLSLRAAIKDFDLPLTSGVTMSSGSTTMNVPANTANMLKVGMTVSHPNLPVGTTITAVNQTSTGATTITLSHAPSSGSLSAGSGNNSVVFRGGNVGLTKSGPGTLVLLGDSTSPNTYSGRTIINNGILSLRHASNLGTAPSSLVTDQLILSGGTLQFARDTSSLAIATNPQVEGTRINDYTYQLTEGTRGVTFGEAGGRLEVGSTNPTPDYVVSSSNYVANPVIHAVIENPIDAYGVVELAVRANFSNPSNPVFNTLTIGKSNSQNNFRSGIKTEGAYEGIMTIHGNNYINGLLVEGGRLTLTGNNDFSGSIRFLSGQVTLQGANTYNGGNTFTDTLSITGTTLSLDNPAALGTGGFKVNMGTNSAILLLGNNQTLLSLVGTASSTISNGYSAPEGQPERPAVLTVDIDVNETFAGSFANGGSSELRLVKTGPGRLTLNNNDSSFAGKVSIQEGTLDVTSIGYGSVPSALGTGRGRSTISPGLSASYIEIDGGALSFSPVGQQITDRSFSIGAGPNAATLVANGTTQAARVILGLDYVANPGNPFFEERFSSDPIGFVGNGPRTLTLSGVNAGDNELRLELSDKSAAEATSLLKAGPGTWVLTGANSFSGQLTVQEGVLGLAANNSAGTVVSPTTVDVASGTFTFSGGVRLAEGTEVNFPLFIDTVLPVGISANRRYYVVNTTATTFRVSETIDGTPVGLSTGTTAVTNVSYVPNFQSVASTIGRNEGVTTAPLDDTFTGNLPVGTPVMFGYQRRLLAPVTNAETLGVLPGGIVNNVTYYVVESFRSSAGGSPQNYFRVSTTPGGAPVELTASSTGPIYYTATVPGNTSPGINLIGGRLDLRNVDYATAETITFQGGALSVPRDTQARWAGNLDVQANSTVTVSANSELIIDGNLLGTRALTLLGEGTLRLRGETIVPTLPGTNNNDMDNSRRNQYVQAGTLILDYSISNTSKLVDVATLVLGGSRRGGILRLQGGSHEEIVPALNIEAGTNKIYRDSGTSTIRLNTINRAEGSSLYFDLSMIATVDNLNVNNILGGWAIARDASESAKWVLYGTVSRNFSVNVDLDILEIPVVAQQNVHYLIDGQPVRFTSTGTLPLGLLPNVTYFVRDAGTRTFKVARADGTLVDVLDAGSGDHTVSSYQPGRSGPATIVFTANPDNYPGSLGNGIATIQIQNTAGTGTINATFTQATGLLLIRTYNNPPAAANNNTARRIAEVVRNISNAEARRRVTVTVSGTDNIADTGSYGPVALSGGTFDNGSQALGWARNSTNAADGAVVVNGTYANNTFGRDSNTNVTESMTVADTPNDAPGTLNASSTYTLRFANNVPTTVTLDETTGGGLYAGQHVLQTGAILVSPTVGANDSIITGPGTLTTENDGNLRNFIMHQYNELGDLVINTALLNRKPIVRVGRLTAGNPRILAGIANTDGLLNASITGTSGIPTGTLVEAVLDKHTVRLSANATGGDVRNLTTFILSDGSGTQVQMLATQQTTTTQNRINGVHDPVTGRLSTSDIYRGMPIAGKGIPAGAIVDLIINDTDIRINTNHFFKAEADGISSTFTLTPSVGLEKLGGGTLILAGDNTYNGVTTLADGVLRAVKLTDAGIAGSLGMATGVPDNLVFNGGTLQYVGESVSTNRLLRINDYARIDVGHEKTTVIFDATTGRIETSGTVGAADRLEKTGSGTLEMRIGANLNELKVEEGRLRVQLVDTNAAPASTSTSNFTQNGATILRMSGGALEVRGLAEAGASQTFGGALYVDEGSSEIRVTSVAGYDPNNLRSGSVFRATTLTLMGAEETTSVVRAAGGTMRFVENPEPGSDVASIVLSLPVLETQQLLSWAVYQNTANGLVGINDFASVSGATRQVVSADTQFQYDVGGDDLNAGLWGSDEPGRNINASEGGRTQVEITEGLTVTADSTVVTVAAAQLSNLLLLEPNMRMSGPGLAPNTFVSTVDVANLSFTINKAALTTQTTGQYLFTINGSFFGRVGLADPLQDEDATVNALGRNREINVLRYYTPDASEITIDNGSTLTLLGGAILVGSNTRSAVKSITGEGNITGNATADGSSDFIVHNYSATGRLAIGANVVDTELRLTSNSGAGAGTVQAGYIEMSVEGDANVLIVPRLTPGMEIYGPGIAEGTVVTAVNTLQQVIFMSKPAVSSAFSQVYTFRARTNFVQNGIGTTSLSGNNTYTGKTFVHGGVLRLDSANAVPGGITAGAPLATSTQIVVKDGVIGLGHSNFTRTLGSADNQVQFKGSGGFAAYGEDRVVDFGGLGAGNRLRFGNDGFVSDGSSFILGAHDATHKVTLANSLDLGSFSQAVKVINGIADIEGELGAALYGQGRLVKFGQGALRLGATSYHSGGIEIAEGRLVVANVPNALGVSSGKVLMGTSSTNTGRGAAVVMEVEGGEVVNDISVGNINSRGPAWVQQGVVDASTTGYGSHSSMLVVNGNPAIAYYDATNQDLKYVRAADSRGNSWLPPVTLASRGNVGMFPSLAIINGFPAVSYYDATNGTLCFIRAADASGASWSSSIIADSDPVSAVAVQADGSVIVGGNFLEFDGLTRTRLARLSSLGVLDTSFNVTVNGEVRAIVVETSGRIIFAGDFSSVNGQTRNNIACVDSAGVLQSYNPNPGDTGTIRTLLLKADGNLLVGGAFTTIGGASRNRIALLNPAGTAEAFNPNVADGEVKALAIESDGSILLGGSFTNVSNAGTNSRNRMARVNSAGVLQALNPNFNNEVRGIAVAADGKIYVGGLFSTVLGTGETASNTRNRLTRLLPDGKVDLTYAMEVDAEVRGLVGLSSGKVVVYGIFNNVGNVPRKFMAGLNSDGSLDESYDPDPDYEVRAAVEAGGKLVIGGLFSNVGGGTQHFAGRLLAAGTVDGTFARKVNDRGQYTSMVSVRGNAAIAYYDVAKTDLRYIRAEDVNGNFPLTLQRWGTTTLLHTSAQDVGKGASLKVVNVGGALVVRESNGMLKVDGLLNNGTPAVAYYNATTNRVNYVLAYFENGTFTNGLAWFPPVEVSSDAATAQLSLELVNEGPAIAYVTQSGALRYVYAVDVGTQDSSRSGVKDPFKDDNGVFSSVNELGLTTLPAWSSPRTLDTGVQYPTLLATELDLVPSLNKRPAVAYVGTGGMVKYIRSQDAGGTNPWPAATTLASGAAASPVNLVITDGVAAVSYQNATDNNLQFVHVSDASGYSMLSFKDDTTVSGDLQLEGMLLLNAEAGQVATLNGAITGTGGFRVTGEGTVAITGSNNSFGSGFTGGDAAVVIRSGNLHLGSSSALGSAMDASALPKISLGDRNGNGFASTVIPVNHATNAPLVLNGTYGGSFDTTGTGALVNLEAVINGRTFTQNDVDAGVVILVKNETVFPERNGIYRMTSYTPANVVESKPALMTLTRDERMDELAEFNTRVQAQLIEGVENGNIYYFLGTVLQVNVSPVVWQSLVPVVSVAHATTGASVLAGGGTFVNTGVGSFTGIATTIGGRTFGASDVGVRILVKDETDNLARNGVYAVTSYTAATLEVPASLNLARVTDLDNVSEFVARLLVQVTQGEDLGETFYLASSVTTLNSSPVVWQKVLTVDRATTGASMLADAGRFDATHDGFVGNTGGPGAFVDVSATIDGRDYTEADQGTLILVKDEGDNPASNGVYQIVFVALQEPGTMNLVRATDMDSVGEFGYGTQVRVAQGTYAGQAFFLASNVSAMNTSAVLWLKDVADGDLSLKIAAAGVELRNNIDVLFRPGAGNMTLGATDDMISGEAYFKGAITLKNNQDGIPELQDLNLRSQTTTGYGVVFEGVISEERGSGTNADKLTLTKTGTGVVTLKGANTFHGGVNIKEGTLLVQNTTGSATGSGNVTVNAGTVLGGTGKISGNVVLAGTGTGEAGLATLRLGDPTLSTGTEVLTIESKLTVGPNSVVEFTLGANNLTQLAANQLELTPTGQLLVKLADGFAPTLGTKYDILNGLGVSNIPTLTFTGGGSNNLRDYLMLPGAYVWDTSLLATTGEIFATGATVPVAIALNGQPAGVTVNPGAGTTINLTVTVTGSPDFTYQWERQTAPDVFVNVGPLVRSSATSHTYTKTGIAEADEGIYRVTVKNGSGTFSVSSNPVSVIVNDPPVIAQQPVSQLANEGGLVTFTATATGPAPISFQWYRGATAINNGGRYTVSQNGNQATLQISAVEAGDAGNNYRVVPINLAGPGVSSNFVSLTLRTKVTIVSFPTTVEVSTGDPAFFRVQASGTAPFTYLWELNDGSGYRELIGETGSTLRLPGMTTDNNGDKVRVTVNNDVGIAVVSGEAVISVVPGIPSILEHPESYVVAEDLANRATVTLVAKVGGAQAGRSVVWKRGNAVVKTGAVTIAGITSLVSITESLDENDGGLISTLVIENISTGLAGDYKVEAKNVNVTKPIVSNPGLVYVASNPKVKLPVQTSAGTKKNKATMTVTVKGPAGKTVPIVKYKWMRILASDADQSTFKDISPEDLDVVGIETKTLTINNVDTDDRGTYACQITTDPVVDVPVMAGTHYLKVYTEAAELAETITFPPAMVGSDFYFQIPYNSSEDKVPDTFKASGLPTGLKLNAKTGEITGRPTKAGVYSTITLTATNKVLPAGSVKGPLEMEVQAIPAGAVGVFAGWLPRNELNSDIGGRFDMTTTATGTFTGKLTLGASVHAFKGNLDLKFAEGSDEILPPNATVTIVRTGKPVAPPPVTLTFICDPANNRLASAAISAVIQREEDGQIVFDEVTLPFSGWRNRWSKLEPANPYLNELAVADGKPPVSGYYTMALLPPAGQADEMPQGVSFATFTVAANGTLKLSGKLADGQALTGAQFVGPQGEIVLFQTLYKTTPRGSLVGQIMLNKVNDAKFADNTITAGAVGTEPTWNCPPNLAANNYLYPAGFEPMTLAVTGGAYEDPHRKRINAADTATQTLLFGIAPDGAADNLSLTFDLEGLDTLVDPSLPYPGSQGGEVLPSTDAVDITAIKDKANLVTGSKVTVPDAKDPSVNPFKTTFVVVGKTAAVSGKVTLTEFDPVFGTGSAKTLIRTTTYYGVIVKTAEGLQAVGFHLLPKRPTQLGQTVAKMPKVSNQVLASPQSAPPAPVQP